MSRISNLGIFLKLKIGLTIDKKYNRLLEVLLVHLAK